jgi:hypothetical protein
MASGTESEVVALVTARLRVRLPETAPGQIEEEVVAVLGTFADSKVRSFLPILVERQALERLRRLPARDRDRSLSTTAEN